MMKQYINNETNEPTIFTSNTDMLSNVKYAHCSPKIKLINNNGIPVNNEAVIPCSVCCNDGSLVHCLVHFFFFNTLYKIKYNVEKTNDSENATYESIANVIWINKSSELSASPTGDCVICDGANVCIVMKMNPITLMKNTGKSTRYTQCKRIEMVINNQAYR